MLKIAIVELPGRVVLQLQGRVIGAWVGEVEHACEDARNRGVEVTLDLADVAFVGREGIALFQRLAGWPVRFEGCSPFVAEQLRGVVIGSLAAMDGGGTER